MEWYQLFESDTEALATIADGKAVTVEAGGKRICLARNKDRFYAIQNECPHSGAPLSKGAINSIGEIVCPLHHYRYRLLDGVECEEKTSEAETFLVELRKEGVFIKV